MNSGYGDAFNPGPAYLDGGGRGLAHAPHHDGVYKNFSFTSNFDKQKYKFMDTNYSVL